MLKQEILEEIFSGNKQIPTVPAFYGKFNELLQEPSVSDKKIADLVMKDQAMVAHILRLSNSALYSRRREVTNLANAITFLGLETLKNLVLEISLVREFKFDNVDIPGFSINTFWEHSLGVAYFAPLIAKKLQVPNNEAFYIGGLLHDIGKLVIFHSYPEEFKEIILTQVKKNYIDIEAEEMIIGVNHCDIGVFFAEKWKFSPEIVGAIRDHHNILKSQGLVVAIIRISNLFAKAAGLCFPWDRNFFDLMGDPTWETLATYAGRQVDVEDIVTEIMEEAPKIKESVKELLNAGQ